MNKTARGFTLVELLVVIAIIAILAAVVLVIINPAELTKRGRDATRLSDLANLAQAINVASQENSDIPNFLCNATLAAPVTPVAFGTKPGLSCPGDGQDGSKSNSHGTEADGTGWVTVNLAGQTAVSVPALPADPSNTTLLHYTYCSNGTQWEISANLESTQQIPKEGNDGGDESTVYEVGSSLSLINSGASVGSCTY